MPHVQANLDESTFKDIKKDAIDSNLSVGDYVKDALVKKLEDSKKNKDDKAAKESKLNLHNNL